MIRNVAIWSVLACGFLDSPLAVAAEKWELRKIQTGADGGYVVVDTYPDQKSCQKAESAARKSDPKGDYGCMRAY